MINARDRSQYQKPILWQSGDGIEEMHMVAFTPGVGWSVSGECYYPEHYAALEALENPEKYRGMHKDFDAWKSEMEYELVASVFYEFHCIPYSSFRAVYGLLSSLGVEISCPIADRYQSHETTRLRRYGLQGRFTSHAPTRQLDYIKWEPMETPSPDSDGWGLWLEVYLGQEKILAVWYPQEYQNRPHLGQQISIKVQGYKVGNLSEHYYPWSHGKSGFSSEHLHPHIIAAIRAVDGGMG